jgi:hypothetical protein
MTPLWVHVTWTIKGFKGDYPEEMATIDFAINKISNDDLPANMKAELIVEASKVRREVAATPVVKKIVRRYDAWTLYKYLGQLDGPGHVAMVDEKN